jgi:hypothetical protein
MGAEDILRGNWEVTELGSYQVDWSVQSRGDSNTATVSLHITNYLSNSSITHFAGYDNPIHDALTQNFDLANPVPNVETSLWLTMTVPVP